LNYLAHIYLSGPNPEVQVGGLLGDFVKGPLVGRFPTAIEHGIHLHRLIDSHTDSQPIVQEAAALLPSPWRRFAGILLDIYFDHLLASQWGRFHRQPLAEFTEEFYRHLQGHSALLPPRALHFSRVAPEVAWLESYAVAARIPAMLNRVGQRFRQPVPLDQAWQPLQQHATHLQSTFDVLLPELIQFAASRRMISL